GSAVLPAGAHWFLGGDPAAGARVHLPATFLAYGTERREREMSIVAAMNPVFLERLFDQAQLQRLRELGLAEQEPLTEYQSPAAREQLARAEVLLTFWGAPVITSEVLAAAPVLKAN